MSQDLLTLDFETIANLIHGHALERPQARALIDGARVHTYAELDAAMDRVAASLQAHGLKSRDVMAICATASLDYVETFLGGLRAGVAVSPLAPSSTPESLAGMVADSSARILFFDASTAEATAAARALPGVKSVALDGSAGGEAYSAWLAPVGAKPAPVGIDPDQAFNIIYSSGTTGAPKGIVQPHRMRWAHVQRGGKFGYGPEAVTIVSTPLYSNTTLVSVFPTLALGGAVALMAKFDAAQFVRLAETLRATHAMLVPVQYRRIMALPDFDSHDLSSFRVKFCTSAPFAAELKADILRRWPGGLVEYYGMTEGGGTCILIAHEFPDKLHTVGKPAEGHEIFLIDDEGRKVPQGQLGEVVGRSPGMMTGYHNQPGKTRDAEWRDETGARFIRNGDIGRFDEDGFLTLMDRKKDMIISGGFNVYPTDLEAVLHRHPSVHEAAVVGVPSQAWGETPVAFVTLWPGKDIAAEELRAWANGQLGKTQRLARIEIADALPRSSIGKVLKRELRDAFKGHVD
jgi:long-chain acyl-CoA synthetase